ncbi:serine hydrolase domain-containing protein [Nocardia sp. NPDC058499]|uniref:serine hydrolase domain-containing protein n=1 Tax=Nocardia sp. NPDC058499 TaxID=3346530 RepID=UPI0036572074
MKIRHVTIMLAAALSISACTIASSDTHESADAWDTERLRAALAAIERAGIPGVFAEVRAGDQVWSHAAGVADLTSGRPVTPDMRHRIGSVTKTFTAAAVLQQVEQGRIDLDAPIGDYLPDVVPGERGREITVRMLLNHTSGLPDYLPYTFPSLAGLFTGGEVSAQSLDDNRFRKWDTAELIGMGVNAPAGAPGALPGVYSNTNYRILGELVRHTTGIAFEQYVTEQVIARAGLEHTYFPDRPELDEPHSRMYEALYGVIDPPRDYSTYDNSWLGPGAGLVSTMADVNTFYRKLFAGAIVGRKSLEQMRQTVPVTALDGQPIEYGLGLHKVQLPGCDTLWGHDGSVFGASMMSLHSADGQRQMSVAVNLVRANRPDATGRPQPHPADDALAAFYRTAMCPAV